MGGVRGKVLPMDNFTGSVWAGSAIGEHSVVTCNISPERMGGLLEAIQTPLEHGDIDSLPSSALLFLTPSLFPS